MKIEVSQNYDKVSDFDIVFKAMLQSDDYHSKKPIIEKKMRRIA